MVKRWLGALGAVLVLAAPMASTAAGNPPAPQVQGAAQSQAPSAHALDLARQYFDAIHYDDTVKSMVSTMEPLLMDRVGAIPGLTADQNLAFRDALHESMLTMMNKLLPRIREKAAPVMAQIYTEEELTQLVSFYATPVGQSILAKQTLLAAPLVAEIRTMMPELVAGMTTETLERFCAKTDCSRFPGGRSRLDSLFSGRGT